MAKGNSIVVIKDKDKKIEKKKHEWIAKMGRYGFMNFSGRDTEGGMVICETKQSK